MAKANPKTDRRGANAGKARALLSEEAVRDLLRPSKDALATLEKIASGKYVRNAATILAAVRTQLEFSQPRPKQTVEHRGAVTYRIHTDAPPTEFDQ